MYPESIMERVRQNLGLEEDDTSEDDFINSLSKNEIFERCCAWEGLLGGWHHILKGWVESIWNVDLDSLEE